MRRPRVHVVPHTHWDREWYLDAATTQVRLAVLVDDVLDALARERSLRCFLLDGQGITLDDYLALRPQRADALRRALGAGRLEAGPWYVLADELLVSGEALVRNLIEGGKAVRRSGGEVLRVGYSPDAFGHSAALPTILAGFGLDVAMVWRGLGGEPGQDGDLYRWVGADGSAVLLHHLPHVGYENGANLPVGPAAARRRWRVLHAMLAPRARVPHWLVLNGADHHALQRDLVAAVRDLRRASGADVRLSSLGDFVAALRRGASGLALPVVSGELVEGRRHAWALQGTHGSRLHLKQDNARCQRLLERRAEPLAALEAARGGTDRRADLSAAWRTLLENHPHDSICGTSADAVHREMTARFVRAESMGTAIACAALDALAGRDADAARAAGREAWRPALLVFQPRPVGGAALVEADVALFRGDLRVGQQGPPSGAALRAPGALRLVAADGHALPLQVLAWRGGVDRVESPRYYPDCDIVEWRRAVFLHPALPPLGVTPVAVHEGGGPPPAIPDDLRVEVREHGLDNGLVWLRVESDGTIALADRRTGLSAHGLGAIEDEHDLGDSYTSSPRGVAARVPDAVAVRVVHAGPLRGELEVLRRWDAVDLTLTTRVRLDAGAGHVVLEIRGENRRDDHRIRAVFPLGERARRVVADGQFGPVERRPVTGRARMLPGELEASSPTAAMQRYVSVAGRRTGMTVCADGLPQYEARANGEVRVTLVRGFGELSRHGLPERPGHAGWPTPTPEGQCRGPFVARLAVLLHPPAAVDAPDGIESAVETFLAPPWAVMRRALLHAPDAVAGPSLEGAGLVFSAMKPAEDGRGIVLRCYNATGHAVVGTWQIPWRKRRATMCRLDETALHPLRVRKGRVAFPAGPRAVVTIRVR
jgi:alpha-mannosidase